MTCSVEHIAEAMPFDRIAVRMHVSAVYELGVVLVFEYYRVAEDGGRVKLGYGEYSGVWRTPGTDGRWQPGRIPDILVSALVPDSENMDASSVKTRNGVNITRS